MTKLLTKTIICTSSETFDKCINGFSATHDVKFMQTSMAFSPAYGKMLLMAVMIYSV